MRTMEYNSSGLYVIESQCNGSDRWNIVCNEAIVSVQVYFDVSYIQKEMPQYIV